MARYMGVDPSTVATGYAIIDENGELVTYGVINPPEDMDHMERLCLQWSQLRQLMLQHCPVAIMCEDQFNGPNVDTLKKIARTSAALMIAAVDRGIPTEMIYPSSWRKIFHGHGNATKKETVKLVNETHGLKLRQKDNDIADAIGIAESCRIKYQEGARNEVRDISDKE